ncbi:hypothetical protein [Duganella sp. CF458]|uniref:hypothetical protein n=1 Tax=Duganella sp. CF458 TaxID=1884368 RepID=UPI00111429AF|nr:hypothetical protein [Duganella sp. CF458]
MTINCTIDSVSMQHLCRPAIIKKGSKKADDILGLDAISVALQRAKLKICVDEDMALTDEWSKTCSLEMIQPILTKWIESDGIILCNAKRQKIPLSLNKKLREANFRDAGDKLIVRIGLAALGGNTPPFLVATNDGDFWDPNDGTKSGNNAAPVASLLREHSIHSTQLKEFFSLLT